MICRTGWPRGWKEVSCPSHHALDTAPALAAATPAPLPEFIAPVPQVKKLFTDAQGFYDSGRYDLANKRYEQILALDPYNDAAHRARSAWTSPAPQATKIRRQCSPADRGATLRASGQHDEQISEPITRKLQNIIVPNIEFRSTTLTDAIEFLRQESRRSIPTPIPSSAA